MKIRRVLAPGQVANIEAKTDENALGGRVPTHSSDIREIISRRLYFGETCRTILGCPARPRTALLITHGLWHLGPRAGSIVDNHENTVAH
jgi:hypothetical protein